MEIKDKNIRLKESAILWLRFSNLYRITEEQASILYETRFDQQTGERQIIDIKTYKRVLSNIPGGIYFKKYFSNNTKAPKYDDVTYSLMYELIYEVNYIYLLIALLWYKTKLIKFETAFVALCYKKPQNAKEINSIFNEIQYKRIE